VNNFDGYNLIEEKLAAARSNSVLEQRDPKCSVHASIKIASDDDPAHVLRDKSDLESELQYFSVFQLDLATTSAMGMVVFRLQLLVAWIKSIFGEATTS
jgi:hypothetical protein